MKYLRIILILPILLAITSFKEKEMVSIVDIKKSERHLPEIDKAPRMPGYFHALKKIPSVDIRGEELFDTMGMLESSNRYEVVNRFGYLGKYQFSQKTLRGLIDQGWLDATYSEVRPSNFLKDRFLQEKAMEALVLHNMRVLKNYGLMDYIGEEIAGVNVTMEGMLAGAHLVGPRAVKLFIKSGGKINKYDGNGTKLSSYMVKFA